MNSRNLFTTLALFLASPSFARAETKYVPDVLEEFLSFVFVKLPLEANSGTEYFVIWFKFMLFLIVYAVLYYGTRKIFKDHNKVAGTVAFVTALASVALIPGKVLQAIFTTYAATLSIALGLVPVFIGLWIYRKIGSEHRFIRGIILLLVGVLSFSFGAMMTGSAVYGSSNDELFERAGAWAGMGGAIAMIMGVGAFLTGGRHVAPEMRDAGVSLGALGGVGIDGLGWAKEKIGKLLKREKKEEGKEAKDEGKAGEKGNEFAQEGRALSALLEWRKDALVKIREMLGALRPQAGNRDAIRAQVVNIITYIRNTLLPQEKTVPGRMAQMRSTLDTLEKDLDAVKKDVLKEGRATRKAEGTEEKEVAAAEAAEGAAAKKGDAAAAQRDAAVVNELGQAEKVLEMERRQEKLEERQLLEIERIIEQLRIHVKKDIRHREEHIRDNTEKAAALLDDYLKSGSVSLYDEADSRLGTAARAAWEDWKDIHAEMAGAESALANALRKFQAYRTWRQQVNEHLRKMNTRT